MKHLLPYLLVVVILIAISSCRKADEYPIEPYIEFKELTKFANGQGKDTGIVITFTFTDGDGDIGFHQDEQGALYTGEFYYNLYLNYQRKNANGQFEPFYVPTPFDSITPNGDTIVIIKDIPVQFTYRMPFMEPSGRNKAIKGDISVDVSTFGFSPVSRFEFYMYDRALHKSNVEFTPEFSVN